MSNGDKAKRATVAIGPLSVDGFQMPDGSYRMSQTQAGESVGLSERNAREFLQSKGFKALMGEGYTPAISDIEGEPDPGQKRGQTRIRGLGLEAVSAYWLWQAHRGNKAAIPLKGSVLVPPAKATKGKLATLQIDIHPRLAALLVDYDNGGAEYLFPGRHGRGKLARSSADWLLDQALDYVGLEGLGISTHSFRRTAQRPLAQICREAGISRAYWYQLEGEDLRAPATEEIIRKIEAALGVDLGVSFDEVNS